MLFAVVPAGTRFSAGSHQANQAYNVQADLHSLVDAHFNALSTRTSTILNEQVSPSPCRLMQCA